MPILHVRNVPDDLYARVQRLAGAKKRSLSAQVVQLLEQAVQAEADRQSQAKILAGIRRRRASAARKSRAPDSAALLREDRNR